VVGLSLLLSFPDLLYWNKLFSSFEYSSNPLLASIGHLAFVTLFLLAANYLFFFRTNIGSSRQLTKAILLQTANTSVQSSIIFVRCTSSVHFHLGHGFGIAFLQNAQLAENSTSSKQINYN
jgi:hypothetical protein